MTHLGLGILLWLGDKDGNTCKIASKLVRLLEREIDSGPLLDLFPVLNERDDHLVGPVLPNNIQPLAIVEFQGSNHTMDWAHPGCR